MKYRVLAVLPFVITVALAAVVLAVGDPSARAAVLRGENETLKILAVVGCAIAALSFEPGEYMRRAWGLHTACFAMLLSRDAMYLVLHVQSIGGIPLTTIEGLLVFVGNLASVVGIWLMARATDEAGLELPGTPARRRAALVVATLVSLVITSGALVTDGRDLAHGNPVAIVGVASDAGDILSMALIAPVLMTAFAMRGGVLRWPWGLFAASLVAWLFYDAARSFFDSTIEVTKLGAEVFRSLACSYTLVAGIAQRWALAPEPGDEPPPAPELP